MVDIRREPNVFGRVAQGESDRFVFVLHEARAPRGQDWRESRQDPEHVLGVNTGCGAGRKQLSRQSADHGQPCVGDQLQLRRALRVLEPPRLTDRLQHRPCPLDCSVVARGHQDSLASFHGRDAAHHRALDELRAAALDRRLNLLDDVRTGGAHLDEDLRASPFRRTALAEIGTTHGVGIGEDRDHHVGVFDRLGRRPGHLPDANRLGARARAIPQRQPVARFVQALCDRRAHLSSPENRHLHQLFSFRRSSPPLRPAPRVSRYPLP